MPIRILVRYHEPSLQRIEAIPQGDWIDLRCAEYVEMKAGEARKVSLGISVKLPEGYEAHVLPRSSTFFRGGVIFTNSMGIVDGSYCGDGDLWMVPLLALRDTVIMPGDRIAQFRVMKKMERPEIVEVEHLDGPDRGGFGSTGRS